MPFYKSCLQSDVAVNLTLFVSCCKLVILICMTGDKLSTSIFIHKLQKYVVFSVYRVKVRQSANALCLCIDQTDTNDRPLNAQFSEESLLS